MKITPSTIILADLIKIGAYTRRNYQEGEIIIKKRHTSDKVYFIKNGCIKASYFTEKGYETIALILLENQIFGINILFDCTYTFFSYTTVKDSILYEFKVKTILELENNKKKLIPLLLLQEEYTEMEKRIRLLSQRSAKKRIASNLKELQKKLNTESNVLDLENPYAPFNQNHIADYTRTSRVTTNNLINSIKRNH